MVDKPTPEPIQPQEDRLISTIKKGLGWVGIILLAFVVAILDVIIEIACSWVGVLLALIGVAALLSWLT